MCCDIIGPSTMMRSQYFSRPVNSEGRSDEATEITPCSYFTGIQFNGLHFSTHALVLLTSSLVRTLHLTQRCEERPAKKRLTCCRSTPVSCPLFHSQATEQLKLQLIISPIMAGLGGKSISALMFTNTACLPEMPTQKLLVEMLAGDATIISHWDFIRIRNLNIRVYWNTVAVKKNAWMVLSSYIPFWAELMDSLVLSWMVIAEWWSSGHSSVSFVYQQQIFVQPRSPSRYFEHLLPVLPLQHTDLAHKQPYETVRRWFR